MEKGSMRAIDAMIVWTPNRGDWANRPTAGKVEVTTIPEPPALRAHPISVGACDHDWKDTDDAGRLQLAQEYFSHMIHRDGIDEATARAAFAQIEEFKNHHFSAEPPEDEKY